MPNKKLVVIGDGPEMNKIKNKASANVEILGYQSDSVMVDYMRRAKAFVFAAEEDFGITPVEAQACGTPVIAFGKGGALETVIEFGQDSPTGILFKKQDTREIIEAVNEFEIKQDLILPINCRKNAELFSEERFGAEIANYINLKWNAFNIAKK